jgi:hypothetical protein
MLLGNITGNRNLKGKFFCFAADTVYFNEYGKALALSLKKYAPWAKIHCHFYNPTKSILGWCVTRKITITYEFFDKNHPEFKTLCACIRFVRIPEIFNSSSRIISLDCDMIATKDIPEHVFDIDTESSKAFVRTSGYPLASSVTFGNDHARNVFADRLRIEFEKNNIYWYLDQNLLEILVREEIFQKTDGKWSDFSLGTDGFLWAAKGSRKTAEKYILERKKYL